LRRGRFVELTAFVGDGMSHLLWQNLCLLLDLRSCQHIVNVDRWVQRFDTADIKLVVPPAARGTLLEEFIPSFSKLDSLGAVIDHPFSFVIRQQFMQIKQKLTPAKIDSPQLWS